MPLRGGVARLQIIVRSGKLAASVSAVSRPGRSLFYFDLLVVNLSFSFRSRLLPAQESFNGAKSWVKELQRRGDPNVIIALAGNKADLEHRR